MNKLLCGIVLFVVLLFSAYAMAQHRHPGHHPRRPHHPSPPGWEHRPFSPPVPPPMFRCTARSNSSWGIGVAYTVPDASQIALNYCAASSPSWDTCFIKFCERVQ